jgi:hypothetical protein
MTYFHKKNGHLIFKTLPLVTHQTHAYFVAVRLNE